MPFIRTVVWDNHKKSFLAQHDFNTRIESAIKIMKSPENALAAFAAVIQELQW